MAKTIDYYFSPMSPWTYLGHARFTEIARRHDARERDMGAVLHQDLRACGEWLRLVGR